MSKKENMDSKNNLFSNTNKRLYILFFVLSMIIFLILSILLITNNISWFDNSVYSIISKLINNQMTTFFQLITFLCSSKFIIITTILILIFCKNRKRALGFGLNALFCSILNLFTKMIFVRPRPVDINIIKETGYSFPSGHSMMSIAFYGLLIYIILTKDINKKVKIFSTISLVLVILLIGLSRIYLGVHYASDVLAGFSLGLAYLVLSIKLIYKKMES